MKNSKKHLLILTIVSGLFAFATMLYMYTTSNQISLMKIEVHDLKLADEQIKSTAAQNIVKERIAGDQCHEDARKFAEDAYPTSLYPGSDYRSILKEQYMQVYTAKNCL